MEHFSLSEVDGRLLIEGFPDAVAVVALSGPKARRIADLALHKTDLEFANGCLDAINVVPEDPYEIQEALWRSAITHFIKCFGDGARFQLVATKIYRMDPPEALQAFSYFKALRNKHFVHDENSFAQADPGAILSKENKQNKIEKIVCPVMVSVTLEQGSYANLKLLIGKALSWVTTEFDGLCNQLASELETEDRQALMGRPPLIATPTRADEINRRRKAL